VCVVGVEGERLRKDGEEVAINVAAGGIKKKRGAPSPSPSPLGTGSRLNSLSSSPSNRLSLSHFASQKEKKKFKRKCHISQTQLFLSSVLF
jgi:hypothetical protein